MYKTPKGTIDYFGENGIKLKIAKILSIFFIFDNKVLIPKDYTILPKIFEAEYSILSALSFIEYVNDQSIVDIRSCITAFN